MERGVPRYRGDDAVAVRGDPDSVPRPLGRTGILGCAEGHGLAGGERSQHDFVADLYQRGQCRSPSSCGGVAGPYDAQPYRGVLEQFLHLPGCLAQHGFAFRCAGFGGQKGLDATGHQRGGQVLGEHGFAGPGGPVDA